jgi:hypothetical protein
MNIYDYIVRVVVLGFLWGIITAHFELNMLITYVGAILIGGFIGWLSTRHDDNSSQEEEE